MKTKIIISFAVLLLNISLVFSGSNNLRITNRLVDDKVNADLLNLLPLTPREATFEDGLSVRTAAEFVTPSTFILSNNNPEGPIMDESFNYTLFAPVTPKEASFDDSGYDENISPSLLKSLAPCTPREAYFNDNSIYSGK